MKHTLVTHLENTKIGITKKFFTILVILFPTYNTVDRLTYFT